MDAPAIDLPDGWSLEWFEELGSTNDHLKQGAPPHGRVVVAERQTAGRGRRGAEWHSVPGEGLTFSVFLKPGEPVALWPRLALAAGLAVADGLGKLGFEAGVKWPNDVWIGGRKVAGILVEAVPGGAVVGIGLNVGTRRFPEEVGDSATSLWREDGFERAPGDVLGVLLPSLAGWSARIGRDFPELVDAVRRRCVLTGERVSLKTADGVLEGRVRGIGASGELELETDDGLRNLIQADEVRVVR